MISTQIDVIDCIQLSEQEIDDITYAAKKDCERKLSDLIDDFDISDYRISFEIVCKVNIEKRK